MKLKIYVVIIFSLLYSCAQVIAPSGGEKDTESPKIITIQEEKTNSLNTFYFIFDEYISLNNWDENFYTSPPLPKGIVKKIKEKTLIINIQDTILEKLTYYLCLNNCVKDITEGNVLDSLGIIFGNQERLDSLIIKGRVVESYSLKPENNIWVMLFNKHKSDSALFNSSPNYIAKTNTEGYFFFPNIKSQEYQIVALKNYDLLYNPREKIAFYQGYIKPGNDTIINLYTFINQEDSVITESTIIKNDTLETIGAATSNIIINTETESPLIFQLLQNEKLVYTSLYDSGEYLLEGVMPGEYVLKCVFDKNQDGKWTAGNWNKRILPEKTIDYSNKITIRDDWDIELDWILD